MNIEKSELDEYQRTNHTKLPPYWTRGETQNFSKLQNECLRKGIQFEDPEFPANESSLGVSNICSPIRWKRPVDIVDKPEFFSDNFDTFDVQPGEFGNRPLLCAMASLALRPNLFKLVVPETQSFHDRYAGIFHFKFWNYDRWVDVVIDDRLPTYKGHLIFLHSMGYREYWSALLEKAFAKLRGSYGALEDSCANSILTDLTGGLSEMYQLSFRPSVNEITFFTRLLTATHNKKPITVVSRAPVLKQPLSGYGRPNEPHVVPHDNFYCITMIDTNGEYDEWPSLFLKNPWNYGDGSTDIRWTKSGMWLPVLCGSEKRIFSKVSDDWIYVLELIVKCKQIEICHLPADKQWIKSILYGKWVCGVSAGGCRNFFESFCHNPQYCIKFDRPDKGKKTCTFIVSLTQKNHSPEQRTSCEPRPIGLYIYRLKDANKRLDIDCILNDMFEAKTRYINRREVTLRAELPPGTYCIIPSTFFPNLEAEFMIQVWSETPHHLEEIKATIQIKEIDEKVEKWIKSVIVSGKWVREVSAGGCRDFLSTFCYNPQYFIKFDRWVEGKKTFIVSLTQLPKKSCPYLPIGFFIYRLENRNRRLNSEFIRKNISQAKTEYYNRREVTLRVELPPGRYCIIPSTFFPNHEARFMVQVLSKTPCDLGEIMDSYSVGRINQWVHSITNSDYEKIKQIEHIFFTLTTSMSNRQKKRPWANFMTILNYTIKTVSTEMDPFFPVKTPNDVFTKRAGDAMTKALENTYPRIQLTFKKFFQLWTEIKFWRATFKRCDPDNKGVLGGFKLRDAFEKAGYNFSNLKFEKIVHKHRASNGQVSFEDFIVYVLELYLGVH